MTVDNIMFLYVTQTRAGHAKIWHDEHASKYAATVQYVEGSL